MLSDRARNLQSNFYPTFYNPLPFVVTSLFYRFDIRSARYRRIVSACASSRYQAHFPDESAAWDRGYGVVCGTS